MAKKIDVTEKDLIDPILFPIGFLGIEPHHKQKEILTHPAKYKVICCGRRTGKTHMISFEIIRGAMWGIYRRQFVVAPTYGQTEIVYNKILDLLTKADLLGELKAYPKSPRPRIFWHNGSEIHFGSADNPDSLRGEAYDRIFLDESGYIKQDAMRAIRPMAFDSGAPIWQTSTPGGKNHFYDEYQKGMNDKYPDIACFHFTTFDNPHISHKDVQQEIEEYGEDHVYVRTEIYGEFVEDIDCFFPQELITNCVTQYKIINREEVYS